MQSVTQIAAPLWKNRCTETTCKTQQVFLFASVVIGYLHLVLSVRLSQNTQQESQVICLAFLKLYEQILI